MLQATGAAPTPMGLSLSGSSTVTSVSARPTPTPPLIAGPVNTGAITPENTPELQVNGLLTGSPTGILRDNSGSLLG